MCHCGLCIKMKHRCKLCSKCDRNVTGSKRKTNHDSRAEYNHRYYATDLIAIVPSLQIGVKMLPFPALFCAQHIPYRFFMETCHNAGSEDYGKTRRIKTSAPFTRQLCLNSGAIMGKEQEH